LRNPEVVDSWNTSWFLQSPPSLRNVGILGIVLVRADKRLGAYPEPADNPAPAIAMIFLDFDRRKANSSNEFTAGVSCMGSCTTRLFFLAGR
jgi:hypothetical protein